MNTIRRYTKTLPLFCSTVDVRMTVIMLAVIGAFVGIIMLGLYFFNQTYADYYVSQVRWDRWWDIERYVVVSGSDWHDQTPQNVYDRREASEVRSHERYKCGENCREVETCRGTGTDRVCTRHRECTDRYCSRPVYDTKVYYKINLWQTVQTENSGGNQNDPKTIYWPALNFTSMHQLGYGACTPEIIGVRINSQNDKMLGCERAGQRRSRYRTYYKQMGNKSLTKRVLGFCDWGYDKWANIPVESFAHGMFYTYQNNVLNCDSLKHDTLSEIQR